MLPTYTALSPKRRDWLGWMPKPEGTRFPQTAKHRGWAGTLQTTPRPAGRALGDRGIHRPGLPDPKGPWSVWWPLAVAFKLTLWAPAVTLKGLSRPQEGPRSQRPSVPKGNESLGPVPVPGNISSVPLPAENLPGPWKGPWGSGQQAEVCEQGGSRVLQLPQPPPHAAADAACKMRLQEKSPKSRSSSHPTTTSLILWGYAAPACANCLCLWPSLSSSSVFLPSLGSLFFSFRNCFSF